MRSLILRFLVRGACAERIEVLPRNDRWAEVSFRAKREIYLQVLQVFGSQNDSLLYLEIGQAFSFVNLAPGAVSGYNFLLTWYDRNYTLSSFIRNISKPFLIERIS